MKIKQFLPISVFVILICSMFPAEAVDVYIFVHDESAATKVTDDDGNVVTVPIRIVGTEPAFVQPDYSGPSVWCKLQGTLFRTKCTPAAILQQIDNASNEDSRQEHNRLCARYALTSFGVPVECQSPDYKNFSDFEFSQPNNE